jgi:hypothetical protein
MDVTAHHGPAIDGHSDEERLGASSTSVSKWQRHLFLLGAIVWLCFGVAGLAILFLYETTPGAGTFDARQFPLAPELN